MQSQLLRRVSLHSRSTSLLKSHSTGLFLRPAETCIVQHNTFSSKINKDKWQSKLKKQSADDMSSDGGSSRKGMNVSHHQEIESRLTPTQIACHRETTQARTFAGRRIGKHFRPCNKRDVYALYHVIEEQLGKDALKGVDKFYTRLATDFAFAPVSKSNENVSRHLTRNDSDDSLLLEETSEMMEDDTSNQRRSPSSSGRGLTSSRKSNPHQSAQHQQSRSKSTSTISGNKTVRSKTQQSRGQSSSNVDGTSDSSSKSNPSSNLKSRKKKFVSEAERIAKEEAARIEATKFPSRYANAKSGAPSVVSEMKGSEVDNKSSDMSDSSESSACSSRLSSAESETPYVPKKGPQKPSDKVRDLESVIDPELMNKEEIAARRLGAFAFDSQRDSLEYIDRLRKQTTGFDIHHVSHQSLRANMNREEEVDPFSLGGLFVMIVAVGMGYYLYKVDQKKHTGIRKKKRKSKKKLSDFNKNEENSISELIERWSPFHSREYSIEELISQHENKPIQRIPDDWNMLKIVSDHITNAILPGKYNSENLYSKLFRLFGVPELKLLPSMKQKEYGGRTLVIDLDTICHSVWHREKGITRTIRPHYYELIQSAAMNGWEIALFGSNTEDMEFMESPEEIAKLDGKGFVSHYLWSKDAYYFHGHRCKDLSRLNRDINRIIVIDSDTRNVQLQPRNALIISPWFGDEESFDEIHLTEQELRKLVERELDKESRSDKDLEEEFDVEKELAITKESQYRQADRAMRDAKRNEIIVRLSEANRVRDRELEPLMNFLQYIMKADVQSIPDMLDDYRNINNENKNEYINIGDEFNRRYQLHMVNERRKHQGLSPVSSLEEDKDDKEEEMRTSLNQIYEEIYEEIYGDHSDEEDPERKKKLEPTFANAKRRMYNIRPS